MSTQLDWLKAVDWLVNFLGVLAGSFLAWRVALYQMHKQSEQQQRRDKELLLAYLDRIKIDLRDNLQWAGRLRQLLDELPDGELELFKYVKAVAQSLSPRLYHELVTTGLLRLLSSAEENALHSAYSKIEGLRAMAEQSVPAYMFYMVRQRQDAEQVTRMRTNLGTYSLTVQEGVELVRDQYYKLAGSYRKSLGYPKASEDPEG